jgi:L-threonylcarbamoyladenylate synthase
METIVGTDCNQARILLENAEVVAIPTETVYGLAANGLDETAVLKIFEAKGRPLSNPLILHFSSKEAIKPYVLDFPPILEKLVDYFWPGPLTLLLVKSLLVPEIITAGLDRVGVRVPAQPLVQELLQRLNFPLAAPSANLYGMISPTQASHVYKQLQCKIPYILDGGACENGIESTIVGLENEQVIVYRLGGISLEQIANIIGYMPQLKNHSESQPLTSGMVKHHYAPNTPFAYLKQDFVFEENKNDGFILLKDNRPEIPIGQKCILSDSGDLKEAAQNLYAAMHLMDQKHYSKLYIERFEEIGLGISMNDRLNRATKKFEK